MSSAPNIATEPLAASRHEPLRLKLCVVEGPDFGAQLVLERGTYRIGKDAANELPLSDSAVSRNHLLVEVLPEGVRVRDNDSTNGSFCEGMRFSTLDVKPLARLTIGRTVLQLLPLAEHAPAAPPSPNQRFGALSGTSVAMRRVFALLERIAPSSCDVLIQGETGSGKSACAEAIHAASARANAPLVVCDLASLPPTLFESELFGHVRGAFTSAHADRAGALERADGGTLFLDEVGDFSLECQPRLLRFLEHREFRPVGGDAYRRVDVRVIAATHKNLEAEVRAGRFREDLYHRLAVVTVHLPSLRERPEDIPFLVDELLAATGRPRSALSAETRAMLLAHSWPGNVRELRNVVERAVSLGLNDVDAVPGAGVSGGGTSGPLLFKEVKDRLVTAFERDYLANLLKRCNGNVSQAAREAGLDRVHLHRLLKKHAIENP